MSETTNDTAAARAEPTEADRDEAQRILFNYAEAIEEHRASRQVACVATVARLIADQRHADTQRTTDAATIARLEAKVARLLPLVDIVRTLTGSHKRPGFTRDPRPPCTCHACRTLAKYDTPTAPAAPEEPHGR